jgi:hypothetical protein
VKKPLKTGKEKKKSQFYEVISENEKLFAIGRDKPLIELEDISPVGSSQLKKNFELMKKEEYYASA